MSAGNEVLAIIPARGGSKGVPRKNVLPLAGKPLILHTVEAARTARHVSHVVVSTDCAEIAAVARGGAGVVWRPEDLSGDTASSESALLHAIRHLAAAENYRPDLVVFLQCTAPLTAPEDIDGTVEALWAENADTAVSVTPFHYFVWERGGDGRGGVGVNHDKRVRPRRQDRAPQYLETGAVYAMRTDGFLHAGHRFFGDTALYVMPAERVLEIDEPADFRRAEQVLAGRDRQAIADALPREVRGLVLDFDGVLTDNRVMVLEDGREAVCCDRGDGMGLGRVKRRGLPILVLSKEQNPVVQARCRKLGIPCRHGIDDKRPVLDAWLRENDLDARDVVYVGNDINDIDCLRAVGCGVAVADAHPEAKAAARAVLGAPGGRGAIRELTDLIEPRLRK